MQLLRWLVLGALAILGVTWLAESNDKATQFIAVVALIAIGLYSVAKDAKDDASAVKFRLGQLETQVERLKQWRDSQGEHEDMWMVEAERDDDD
jgi:hypothetical protein